MSTAAPRNYRIAQLDEVPAQNCPCGTTRRAFATPEASVAPQASVASIHLLDVSRDARTHYHKTLTEIYLVLEGEGHLELDGELVPVRPLTAVMIRPGCRHRAIGNLRIINIPVPAFDPSDEWFD